MDPYGKPKSSFKPILLGALAVLSLFFGYKVFFGEAAAPRVTKAVVVLKGDSPVTGTVTFEQRSPRNPVKVTGKIKGLTPNASRGFHVHVSGDLSGGCLSAGAHFNPYGKTHGAPDASSRHVGDLGNIESDESGEANFVISDRLISLSGLTSIVGRSVVVHAGTDDLGRGGNDESLKTGNAGARAACGVIGLA
ncbi:superoxide dismutase [Flammula alnicola]|nr:superoxide dismutase [Flammula alnicola]